MRHSGLSLSSFVVSTNRFSSKAMTARFSSSRLMSGVIGISEESEMTSASMNSAPFAFATETRWLPSRTK